VRNIRNPNEIPVFENACSRLRSIDSHATSGLSA
jgi:hypothetical protein